jgi:short-subunit dehydrogenase
LKPKRYDLITGQGIVMSHVLAGQTAVVTGASSGIGRAIALALAESGVSLCLIGRQLERLQAVADIARKTAPQVHCYPTDLTIDADIHRLHQQLAADVDGLDLLIHSAAVLGFGKVLTAPVEDLDWHYQSNVRAPYLLTQTLLPRLIARQGQIVFMNSSITLRAAPNASHYAATKHALKAFADALRAEVNPDQVRVITIFPGRTATPRQAKIYEEEGKVYDPERLIQPEDVATIVVDALSWTRSAEVTEIHVRPFMKP